MTRFTILTVIAGCLCVGPSLSLPDMNDLEAAAAAFEDISNRNNAMDEMKLDADFLQAEASESQNIVPPIEVLNVKDDEVIERAREGLLLMKNQSMYDSVNLLNATRQHVGMYKYNFKLSARQVNGNVYHAVICDIESVALAGSKTAIYHSPYLKKQDCKIVRNR